MSENEFKSSLVLRGFMRTRYPTASAKPGQKGLLRGAQKASTASGFPIDFELAAQFELLPQCRAQEGKEAGAH